MRKLAIFAAILAFSFMIIPHLVAPVYAEPPLTEVLTHLGFTNVALASDETFPAGTYDITLYAEFAGYHNENELSYYETGTATYNLIFAGPEGQFGYLTPPLTKTFTIEHEFGLSMLTPEQHRYFTQNWKNPDGKIHSKVYRNLDDPYMFLIGFENLYGAGDRDYQDFVFSIRLQTPQQEVPEVPFGTVISLLGMSIAFIGFAGFKRWRPKP